MGPTFDALLGRRSTKLTNILKDSITRATLLKNRQEATFSFTLSDIVQLLNLGYPEQALLRVDSVMKIKNMVEVYDTIEFYCNLLLQSVSLIERSKDCPAEVKEGITTLIFASWRIGDFPELHHLRDYFSSKYGKEFVSQATDFPKYCGVNEEIIKLLSKQKPSLDMRIGFLREIAMKNGITLNLDSAVQQRGQEKKGGLVRW